MKGPKVVLIGAGSAFFGRKTIWSMVCKEALCTGTLALVDEVPEKLDRMVRIAERAREARGVPLRIEASTDRCQVLKGADFVILAFAKNHVEMRGVDSAISTRHGMIMCSGDTIGPGGTFRTLREVPRQGAILQDVTRLCPHAWVINWVNPTAAMGIAMMRHFPQLRTMAICDVPENPRYEADLCVRAGLAKSRDEVTDELLAHTRIRAGGVNHFIWLFDLEHNGRDLRPKVYASLKKERDAYLRTGKAEGHYPSKEWELITRITIELADAFGYIPLCTGHTMEYLPYFQGHDRRKKGAITLEMWSVQRRRRWMREQWKDMDNLASGRRPMQDFFAREEPDHASKIIESMWTGNRKRWYINVPNKGAVPNLPDDAYLELPCVVDMNAVKPLPFGPIPRPLLGFIQRVLDEHELAVEAAVTCDRKTLRSALLASMIAVSIPDVNACMEEMLRRERAELPPAWFR